MKIGIIGAGNIAGVVGALWAKAGHQVRFGARHPANAAPLVAAIGSAAAAGLVEEAADFGEVIFTSFPYGAWPQVAAQIAPRVAGKALLDSANPYPARDGAFAQDALAGQGAGVPVAALLPGAPVVRAFNSVYFRTLETEAHRTGARVGIPLATDDPAAMEVAVGLVRDAGFDPVRVGPLALAAKFDPGTRVYNTGMSGQDVAAALGLPWSPQRDGASS